jgi:L-iditol 2-dehydrogenase
MTMKAAVLTEPGKLTVQNVPAPNCPPEGVLVEVRACGICSADIKMAAKGHRALIYPRILGHEISGKVVETRSRRFNPGDRVQIAPGFRCGRCRECRRGQDNQCKSREILGFTRDGGFAEYIGIPLDGPSIGSLTRLPEYVGFGDATFGEPLACCINAQEKTDTGSGDTVLIVGAGPLGLLHAFVAKTRGAKTVLLSEIDEHRQAHALKSCADLVLDPSEESFFDYVMAATSGKGVDVLVFACSQVSLDDAWTDIMAPCGRVSIFSGTPHPISQCRFDANAIHYKEIRISGAYGCTARQNTEAIRLMASDPWSSEIFNTRRVSLENIEQEIGVKTAHGALKSIVEVHDGR